MKTSGNLTKKAQAALRAQFAGSTDDKGYVRWPQDNLVPGVVLEQFEADLRQGDGDELGGKFCAIHSSAALAVNCFAPFKVKPDRLVLLGRRDFDSVCFERKLDTGFTRKPNLDVWVEGSGGVVGIESKLLEHIAPKFGAFREKYQRRSMPWVEECWWKVWDDAKQAAAKQYLDVAQLAKHYFGLSRLLKKEKGPVSATLLYLFWEPDNASDFPEFREHRREVEALATAVKSSAVSFEWRSYPEIWQDWSQQPDLVAHVEHLRRRYRIRSLS